MSKNSLLLLDLGSTLEINKGLADFMAELMVW